MSIKAYTLGSLIVCAAAVAAYGQAATDAGAPTQPPKLWDASAAVGLTLTKGNSDTLTVNGNVQASRKWAQNELNLGADLTYGENTVYDKASGQNITSQTANNYGGYAQYNRLFTERLFGFARAQGLHDGLADLDYRITLSAGAGYYLLKSTNTSLRLEAGPGVVFQKQAGVDDTYMTLRFAERWDEKLNDHVKIWQTLEYLPDVQDWGRYVVNFEIGVETAIIKHLSQRTYFQDSYSSEPAPGRKQNDMKLVAALAYKF